MAETKDLLVTEIERGAFHDGPGIRTTVFLAGCPLHCPWCCNPETQQPRQRLLHDRERCQGCGTCARVCPLGAVTMVDGRPRFDRRLCDLCGLCAAQCPAEALSISGVYMTAEEVLAEVMRDLPFYQSTGGGLTLSGGEPFYQGKAALRLLRLARQSGLHTAVETTANVDSAVLTEAASLVDLFMVDLKHPDADKLREDTGADLELILANVRLLRRLGAEVWLRTAVIPGFNDDEATLHRLAALVQELEVSHYVLLPYHSLGKAKYDRLDMAYLMGETPMLKQSDLAGAASIARGYGLEVSIGG